MIECYWRPFASLKLRCISHLWILHTVAEDKMLVQVRLSAVLLNNGVLDIWWVLGGQSVDINKIHYRNIRLLSTVYQCLGYTYEMSSLYLPIIWVYIYSLSNHHPHQTEQFPLTISSSTIYPAYDQSWVCISRLYPGKKLMVLKWMKYK